MKKPKPWTVRLYTVCGCVGRVTIREEPAYSVIVPCITETGSLMRRFRVLPDRRDRKLRYCEAVEVVEAIPAPHPGGGTEEKADA